MATLRLPIVLRRHAPLALALAGALIATGGCSNKDGGSSDASADGGSGDGGSGDGGSGEASGTPVANAGPDQSVEFSGSIQLDGSGSYDPDGDSLVYSWAFESAPTGSSLAEARTTGFSSNGSADAVTPTFLPDLVGTYVIGLMVSDGAYDSSLDYVIIEVEAPVALPVANAGADQAVDVGATATLNGSASYDPSGGTLGYTWSVVQVPYGSAVTDASLTGADTAQASFTVDARGAYVLSLQVDNGLGSSAPDAVVVTGLAENGEPVASAGADQSGYDCTAIQLDASASADPDDDPLSYYWDVQTVPAGSTAGAASFSDRAVVNPTFYADINGVYELSVTVNDGENWSTPDVMLLTVEDRTYNSAPEVEALPYPTISGGDVECEVSGYGYECDSCNNQSVTLSDYIDITDPDNDPYTVEWEILVGEGSITNPTSVDAQFVLEDIEATEPGVCDSNEFVLQITATDCTGATGNAQVTVVVECCGVEPAVDSGPSK